MTNIIKCNDGNVMPSIGLGTWQIHNDEVKQVVKTALDVGYKHIDTAFNYENEDGIGQALGDYLEAGKVKREDIFIVTKLPMIHMQPSRVRKSLEGSLQRLRLRYVDLYLIHSPVGYKYFSDDQPMPLDEKGRFILDYSTSLTDIWKELEKLVDAGLTKSIGVSNFNSKQIKRLCKIARIQPVTNQIECHLYFQNTKLVEFCKRTDIVVTAYSPFCSPGRPPFLNFGDPPRLFDDETVTGVAMKYKKTPAQVLLKALLQKGYAVIPKSVSPDRIKENFQVCDFHISNEDMERLDNIKQYPRIFGDRALKCDHPEYPFDED